MRKITAISLLALMAGYAATSHAGVITGTFDDWLDSTFETFGDGTNEMSVYWSVSSTGSGYLYTDVAVLTGVTDISEVTDAASLSYSSITGQVFDGQFVAVRRNLAGGLFYGVLRFDEVICPDGCSNPSAATLDATWWFQTNGTGNFATVPEPSTLGLLGAGLFALGFMRRKRAA